MATELDFLRDQNQRLSTVLRQHQMENLSKYSPEQKAVLQGYGDDTLEATMADRSFLAPLIVEYDKHLEEVNGQLKYYQIQVGEMKLQLENVTKENERLHGELKEAVEKQLESLPFGTLLGTDVFTDEEMCRNLQEQLQLANQEKNQAVELWQTVSQELDRLQKLYQDHITDAQIYVVERQKQKDRLTNLKQLTQQLHVANENIEMTNQQFLKTVTEQTVEIEQLRKQLRQAKLDLRVATAKVGEMTRLVEDLQGQIQKKVEDMEVAQGREEASDRRLYQLQSSIKQLEARLCVAVQEAEQLRTEKTNLEKQMKELHIEFTDLENEKYEAVVRARNSMQLLEEANLQKNQALLEEKQKEEDIEKMKETLSRLLQETAVQTRKEECGDKQGQIEQVIREKRAVEEELEKVYREHRGNEDDYRKLEEMHQRCLIAERNKDDLQLRLKAAQNRIKQLEISSEEEMSRSQERIKKLQSVLESERKNCGTISEQRLKLQQENEQLQKDTEDLRKIALEAQQKAKLQISTMEHEFSAKEHGYEIRLRELEDSNHNSTVELRRLLVAQQKATNQWKDETKKITEAAETKISNLKSELNRQKLHTLELLSQLETANEKVVENEKIIMEHQEKNNRLQRRLSQAEQRAASASQQLSVITVQRRKAASMMDLENI
ncbi:sodium channel and clathrin linker 1 isoform X3 [Petaurus breviceps papuanus]|uniref:sodium channel and clathrin linker 1 isoform X3 n=1 Tax=Petaurus breviceps papuanus TaxID=3040969 RepID=UPI0036D9FA99